MKQIALVLLRLYQYTLSPIIGTQCRFAPTCSHYAHEAISRHGLTRGAGLAVRRVFRCHPWNPGGYDPVPSPDAEANRTTSGITPHG